MSHCANHGATWCSLTNPVAYIRSAIRSNVILQKDVVVSQGLEHKVPNFEFTHWNSYLQPTLRPTFMNAIYSPCRYSKMLEDGYQMLVARAGS